jgi:hypothetical protein
MNLYMVALRLVHIGGAVFWAGTVFFIVLFLEPSVRAAGPDGAKVMRGIQQRNLLNILPVVAALTILSGVALYWRASVGFNGDWMASRIGTSLTIGAVASIAAFVIGIFVMRASTLRAGRLAATALQSDDDTKVALMGEVQALRIRARTSARWVAALLAVAVATMSVGRYL